MLPNKKSILNLPRKGASLPLKANLGRRSIRRFNKELAIALSSPYCARPLLSHAYLFSIFIKFTSIQINSTPLLTHIARMIIFALLFIRAPAQNI